MAWAREIKNLTAEIKTGHRDRTVQIGKIKKDARDILEDADVFMKRVAAELKDAAKELRDFLAKSEELRKRDFDTLYKEIQAQIKDIKADVKDFLAKSEDKRMADFKATMEDITEAVEGIQKTVKGMLNDYGAERKEAAAYWASLKKRGVATEEAEEESVPKTKGKSKKHKE